MKHSISKIFSNLNIYMLFILFISTVALLLTLEHQLSVKKVQNLNEQKSIMVSITELKKEDVELALVLFNGKSAQLHRDIEKLQALYKYNVTGKYILGNESDYIDDLKKLTQLTNIFNQNAHTFIKAKQSDEANAAKESLKKSFSALNRHIELIKIQDMRYNEAVFIVFEKPIIFTFLIILMGTLFFRTKIGAFNNDIKFLSSSDKNVQYQIFSIEADAISQRMKRKSVTADNPSFIDQITGIYNEKGLADAYAGKKSMKDKNFTSVSVIEIDNFSKSKRAYDQELTQTILKKVAFTISLNEEPNDIIARTDYNQYTIVFSRASKEQAFKDVDIIRQSISELKFKTPKGENITVCGGHITKPSNTNLEEAIKAAKEILNYTKSVTRNKVYQTKDIAKSNL